MSGAYMIADIGDTVRITPIATTRGEELSVHIGNNARLHLPVDVAVRLRDALNTAELAEEGG
jgi:carbonic anhydrase/acetyltransferase-like protein (isoleucine patch superfamily)